MPSTIYYDTAFPKNEFLPLDGHAVAKHSGTHQKPPATT